MLGLRAMMVRHRIGKTPMLRRSVEVAGKASEITQPMQVVRGDAVRIKMHDIITNFENTI